MSDTKLNEAAEPQAEVTAAAAPAPERVKPRRRFLHLSILQRVTISQIIYIVLFAVAAVMIFFAARDQQAQQDALDVDGIYAVHEQAAQLSAALARAGAEIKRADVQPERLKQAAALALQARGEIEQLNALITALPATQVKTKILEPFKQYVEPNFQRYERLVIARITAGEQPEADIVLELSQNMSAALSAMEQQAVKGIYRSTNNANRLLAYLPQAMFLGLAVMFLSAVSGCLYMLGNIEDEGLSANIRKHLPWLSACFVASFVAFVVSIFLSTGYAVESDGTVVLEKYKYWHNFTGMPAVAVIFLAGVLSVLYGIGRTCLQAGYRRGIWWTGAGTVLAVMAVLMLAGYNGTAYYPSSADLQSSLTIENSSSSEFTLKVMTYVSFIIPFVLAYIVYAWRSMDRKPITSVELETTSDKY